MTRLLPSLTVPLPHIIHGLSLLVLLAPVAVVSAAEVRDSRPVLEVRDSQRVHLSAVRLSQDNDQLTLRGRASRPIARRGFIPGAVQVSLHDPSGQTLATRTIRPMRPNRQARFSDFFVQLPKPDPMPTGTQVRVVAVPVPSH
ncbi:hypothetical protein Thiowin_01338 [Thiorhodovibrio winogradskyi]|uniref:Uncharacterized protein n=1 Tax=Thiorhodovibrio winogradskyi TaxID=77007 RepID=A0ABZ0S7A2_9GAMM|nr:hypothetical protein [Thiorhodovibrio winogradskyi]